MCCLSVRVCVCVYVCGRARVRVHMRLKKKEQKDLNGSLFLHPSCLSLYKDNVTPGNVMRQLVFECTQVWCVF